MEELLPVAAKLTERYTAGRSMSVTYEKACQMMEAVLYCIRQGQGENQMTGPEKLSAEKAWRYGLTGVLRRFQPGYRKQMYNLCEILLQQHQLPRILVL